MDSALSCPFDDDAWLESKTRKGRPHWKKVRVLKQLRNRVFLHPDGDLFCTARTVLVQVDGEPAPRAIARERLKSQGAHAGE